MEREKMSMEQLFVSAFIDKHLLLSITFTRIFIKINIMADIYMRIITPPKETSIELNSFTTQDVSTILSYCVQLTNHMTC